MTLETLRQICLRLPGTTEDVKWGHDLCFCVSGKMFAAVDLEPPHSLTFKCTPDSFGELVERPGIRPAPYMARNLWVQEERLGDVLERAELEALLRVSYDLVVAGMPKSRRPGAGPAESARQAMAKRQVRSKASRRRAGAGGAKRLTPKTTRPRGRRRR